MTEQEFKAQMERIYAYNRKRKQDEQKLSLTEEKLKIAEEKLQKVWNLLPSPSDIPTLSELLKMLSDLRSMRNSME